VRTRGDAERYAEAVRAILQLQMPASTHVTVTALSDVIGERMRSWRLGASVFVAFGALAMVLAAVGLYSAISYNVTQRTHEMGVRRALGAQASDVAQLVVTQGLILGGTGAAIGSGIAFAAAN
jgi:putative ABC transport system permease protein